MFKRAVFFAVAAVLASLLVQPSAFALYQWVDERGNVHITDYPKPSPGPIEQEQLPAQSAPPFRPEQRGNPAAAEMPRQPVQPAAMSAPQPVAEKVVVAPPPSTTTQPVHPSPEMQPAQTAPPAFPAVQEAPTAGMQPGPGADPAIPPDAVVAMIAGFMTLILAVSVGMYIYFSLCMYLIAKKLNVPAAWTAWFPILQVWPYLGSAGKPLWWLILLLIPLVNIIVGVYLWMRITENLGRNSALGLLMLLPIVNFIWLGVLAFSRREEASASPAVAY